MALFDVFKTRAGSGTDPTDGVKSNGGEETRNKFDLVLVAVRRLLRRGAIQHVTNLLGRLHPADIARVINHLPSDQEKCTVFDIVEGEDQRGQVLSELNEETILQVLEHREPGEIVWLLKNLGTDDVAFIVGILPEGTSKEILSRLKTEESQEVAHLLTYPKGTAGSMMTTEFFSLPEETTAQEAIQQLQLATKAETVFYIYATDSRGHLAGVLSLRELLTVSPSAPLKAMFKKAPIRVSVETDHEEAARQVANYNLLAIPVVEKDGRMVGIITVDDVIDVIQEEGTKDMLKMAGAMEEDSSRYTSSLGAVGLRLPWLFTNLLGGLASGLILWYFRFAIQEVVALVTFIPVITAMGGNVGLQSSTLIIRGLATGRVEPSDLWVVLFRELRIGLFLGLICGGVLMVAGWLWQEGSLLGPVVGSSIVVAFLISTGMATITPLLLKRMDVDPAVAAGPFITTANDITGVTIYLTMASLMLEHLR